MSNIPNSDESLNSYIDWLCEKADRDLCRKYLWLRRFHNPVGLRTLNPPPKATRGMTINSVGITGDNPVLSSRYQPFVSNRGMPIEHPLSLGSIGFQMYDPSKMDLFYVPQYDPRAFTEEALTYRKEDLPNMLSAIRKILGVRKLTWRISKEWKWDLKGTVVYDLPSETLVVRSFGPIRYARWTNHLD